MAQREYHNPGTGYMGTTSNSPTPYTRKTTDAHKGDGKGKDIKTRNHSFAISPSCKVFKSQADYDAGKVSHEIVTTRNNTTARKRAKVATEVARKLPEVSSIAFKDAAQLFGN